MDDRSMIDSQIGALAVGVDARRWDALIELFAAQVQVDYTSLFGGDPQTITREQLVGGWRALLPGFTRTTHVIGAPSIRLDGNFALAEASVAAWHHVDDPTLAGNDTWLVRGCYEMRFERQGAVWLMAALTLARAWVEGNTDLPRIAGERAAKESEK